MPTLQSKDGFSLFYKDWGTGRPVVLLSSWFLDSDMWEFQFPALLDAGFRCIALDRRGHGRSDQPNGPYDYDTLAADVDALFQHLDLKDAVIVGQSMGGGEALRYLSHYGSERVKGLITIGATIPFMVKTEDNPLGIERASLEATLAWVSRNRFSWTQASIPGFFGEGAEYHPKISDWIWTKSWNCSYRAMVECQKAVCFTDLREDARKANVPVLVIVGRNEQSTSVELSEEAVGLMPQAELLVYEDAAHALYITHAERLNQDLVGFVGGLKD